jgi:hypothetical protein
MTAAVATANSARAEALSKMSMPGDFAERFA